MKTLIASYDLARPSTPVARPGDTHALVLVRHGERLLGAAHMALPSASGGPAVLSQQALDAAIAAKLPGVGELLGAEPFPASFAEPVSVVVCTRDRPEALRRCLDALSRLDYPHYEVIVVDNASQGAATRDVVAATAFRYVREERSGLSRARNRGVMEAQHAIVAFTDDDVLADPGWLRALVQPFADPAVGLATGLVLPAELETRAQHLFEIYSGMSKGFAARVFFPADMDAAGLIATHHLGVGANMALRRAALTAIGGFNPSLGVGTPSRGGEDLHIFHRVLVARWLAHYQPGALVWHQHRRDMGGLQRQVFSNGCAFGCYLLEIGRMRTVARREVASFAWGWAHHWLLARLALGLRGKLDVPLALAWAEVAGALQAPGAYLATRRQAARLSSGPGLER